MKETIYSTIILCTLCVCLIYCHEGNEAKVNYSYHYIEPQYDAVRLEVSTDTIRFNLKDTTYNKIRTFNLFQDHRNELIAFYNSKAENIQIYNIISGELSNEISLKQFLKEKIPYETYPYVKGYDSILIVDGTNFLLFDSVGNKKRSILLRKNSKTSLAFFDSRNPPLIKQGIIIAPIRPVGWESKTKEVIQRRALYSFDLSANSFTELYNFPESYVNQIYEYKFRCNSYCFNDNNQVIFSFPVDSNIYVSDLSEVHKAYYGKGKGITDSSIQSVNFNDIKEYYTRDVYGAIYFDPVRRRYLRVLLHKMKGEDYPIKRKERPQSIIIFDEHFQIIGQSPIDTEIDLDKLFITKTGSIYARANKKDRHALNFVRLDYIEQPAQLSRIKYK